MLIVNYPDIKYIDQDNNLGVFYGVTSHGVPVWGRLKNNEATEVHPIYARNHHSKFIKQIIDVYKERN